MMPGSKPVQRYLNPAGRAITQVGDNAGVFSRQRPERSFHQT